MVILQKDFMLFIIMVQKKSFRLENGLTHKLEEPL